MQAALDAYYAQNGIYPLSSDPSALPNTGINLATIATSGGLGTYAYGYESTYGSGYGLWSVTSVNGNYMVGTGAGGISNTATLSLNIPTY
jgi:hypothetical protein